MWVVGALMERSTTDAEVFRKHMKDANRGEKTTIFGDEKVALVVKKVKRKTSIWKNNLINDSLDVPNLSDNTDIL